MPKVAQAQMNVRLSQQVKDEGDAVLKEMGVTPTEFVRAVWEKIAQGAEERAKVEAAVFGRVTDEATGRAERIDALRRARSLYQTCMSELGISCAEVVPSSLTDGAGGSVPSDDDAYVRALVERMRERGTW